MPFLRCSEVAPPGLLRARADPANQAALHQAGKACACRAWSACDPLLATGRGREVTRTIFRDRWNAARERAALAYSKLAADIRSMYLRDMRKRTTDLAYDTDAASSLLQHSSVQLTSEHCRTRVTKLKAARQVIGASDSAPSENAAESCRVDAPIFGLQAAPVLKSRRDSKSRGVKPVPVRFRPPAPLETIGMHRFPLPLCGMAKRPVANNTSRNQRSADQVNARHDFGCKSGHDVCRSQVFP